MSDLELLIDGAVHAGWTSVQVSRSMERAAATFAVRLTERWQEGLGILVSRPISAGVAVTVRLDGEDVLRGYVDAVSASIGAREHGLEVSGRDVVGDLIDGAATVDGPFEWRNLDLSEVAQRIAEPYGINITCPEPGKAFERFALQPGESAFAAIERGCRLRALLPIADGNGGLVLGRHAAATRGQPLTYGVNVLSASLETTFAERHSPVVVRGQAESVEADAVEGRCEDDHVGRWRPAVFIAEGAVDAEVAQQRAEWRRNVSRGRSRRLRVRVQGWRGSRGLLWQIGTLSAVTAPPLDLSTDLLVSGVTFRRDRRAGTTTDLELTDPDAYAIAPPGPEPRQSLAPRPADESAPVASPTPDPQWEWGL